MKIIAKEIRRIRALYELSNEFGKTFSAIHYQYELDVLRRVQSLLLREKIYND